MRTLSAQQIARAADHAQFQSIRAVQFSGYQRALVRELLFEEIRRLETEAREVPRRAQGRRIRLEREADALRDIADQLEC